MTNTDNPTEQERAEQVATDLERFAADLDRYIAFLRDNPDIAAAIGTHGDEVHAYAYVSPDKDVKAVIADFSRRARRAGAEMTKDVTDDYAGANLTFGNVTLAVYSQREQVCERIVVGTREIEVEEPDPELLAKVPTVKRTKKVEDVRWECTPLLAPAADDAEAVAPR